MDSTQIEKVSLFYLAQLQRHGRQHAPALDEHRDLGEVVLLAQRAAFAHGAGRQLEPLARRHPHRLRCKPAVLSTAEREQSGARLTAERDSEKRVRPDLCGRRVDRRVLDDGSDKDLGAGEEVLCTAEREQSGVCLTAEADSEKRVRPDLREVAVHVRGVCHVLLGKLVVCAHRQQAKGCQ